MEHIDIYKLLSEKFGGETIIEHVMTGDEKKGFRDPFILVKTDAIADVSRYLKEDGQTQFDMLHLVSAVDWPDYFESVYHLFSMKIRHRAILKVRTPKDNPKVPSVTSIWPSANWHERECFDMMGIVYENHPDLTRILCPEEWEGHPLRKDYQMPEHDHLREIGL